VYEEAVVFWKKEPKSFYFLDVGAERCTTMVDRTQEPISVRVTGILGWKAFSYWQAVNLCVWRDDDTRS
jgi:hypothetical protein